MIDMLLELKACLQKRVKSWHVLTAEMSGYHSLVAVRITATPWKDMIHLIENDSNSGNVRHSFC